ncbi:MAG: arginine--tRNA ligase, partial [Planctomycetota bacterium]|nr:arginine--tRNA ligase [Planctomycetota bacterium]
PPQIAGELAEKVAGELELLTEARALGPYLNLFVNRQEFARSILLAPGALDDNIGQSSEGEGKVIAIDFSSPNIAKPFHVGHLRSTIIGSTLYRIFASLGYECVGINHLGDWGTQFGKQIVGLKHWGEEKDLEDLDALNALYVRYHEEEEKNPALTDEAREWFRRQEEGDPEALALWEKIRQTSLEYFKKIYDRLSVRFDHYTGESFFNDKMDAVVERADSLGLTSVSEGALVIDLESHGIDTPALLRKADGATLYMTRDRAAACHRHETYKFEKLLYVVGTAQSLHFRQLFKVLELMEEPWAKDCAHVNFGLVQGMSSRKGNVIDLEELLDEARNRAQEYMSANVDKRPELEDEEAVAEAVGIAAIFFSDLSKQRIKDYNFSWERAISFEGDTGPYLMNAHARIAGIIRKCGIEVDPEADVTLLQEQSAHDLVSLVSRYTDALREAAKTSEPSILAAYLLDLARALHSGYKELRVKDEEDKLAGARLLLLAVVKNVLASGMRILGIKPLEKM